MLTREAAKASVIMNIADSIADPAAARFVTNNAAVFALAKGIKGSGKPLILTSGALYAAADPDGKETDERSPRWPDDPFFAMGQKPEKDNLVYKHDGLRVCIVRLAPYVYGRGGSGVKLLMQMFASAGKAFHLDGAEIPTSTVPVEDAARFYLLLAENPTAEGIYNATSETTPTRSDLARTIAEVLGIECEVVPFETIEEKLGLFFGTFVSAACRANSRKATEELGWDIQAERGILEEAKNGSYVALAQQLKKENSSVGLL